MLVAQFRVVRFLCLVDKREYENGWAKFPLVSQVLDWRFQLASGAAC